MRSIQILIIVIVILLGCGSAEARQAETDMDREAIETELREAREEVRDAARRLAELSAMLNEPAIGETIHHVMRQVRGPRLGIAIAPSEDPVGVQVRDVFDDSAADQAGLRTGDIIVAANNRPLDSGESPMRVLGETIRAHGSNAPMHLEIVRDGERMTIEAELPEVPAAPMPPRVHIEREWRHDGMPETPMPPDARAIRERVRHMVGGMGALGPVRLTPMNDGLAHYFGTADGLLVLSVPDDADSQLRAGDVILAINGESVRRMHDAIRLLRRGGRNEAVDAIELEILREGERRTLSIESDESPLAWLGHH